MAGKMYYTEEEALQKLGMAPEQLEELVRGEKLKAFQDGARKMFRVEEVDALAAGTVSDEEIELAPVDASDTDAITLSDTSESTGTGKDDTVLTAEGISIFDDEDLEIEAADPMAKTQIAPSLEEQLSGDSVGGGSGLLDLTRESDDTSLGAEILDHIDMDSAIGSSLGMEETVEPDQFPRPEVASAQPLVVEEIDPSAGLFSGIIVGSCLVMLMMGAVMVPAMSQVVPGYLKVMWDNQIIVLVVAAIVVGVAAISGYFVGKSAAAREMAMRQVGS